MTNNKFLHICLGYELLINSYDYNYSDLIIDSILHGKLSIISDINPISILTRFKMQNNIKNKLHQYIIYCLSLDNIKYNGYITHTGEFTVEDDILYFVNTLCRKIQWPLFKPKCDIFIDHTTRVGFLESPTYSLLSIDANAQYFDKIQTAIETAIIDIKRSATYTCMINKDELKNILYNLVHKLLVNF